MHSNGNNRRAHARYDLRTALRYRSGSEWTQGVTRDMSAGGLLVEIPEELPLGSTLELGLDWTGLYHDREVVRLFVRASVVRRDERGTALRILHHQFRAALPAVVQAQRAVA